MSDFEDKHVYAYPQQPLLWKRSIDDTFSDVDLLKAGIIWFHKLFEQLSLYSHIHSRSVTFWGSFLDKRWIKKVYKTICQTDRQTHVSWYNSEHPKRLTDPIPYSQLIRLIRIHRKSHHLSRAEIEMYFHFFYEGLPQWYYRQGLAICITHFKGIFY